MTYDGYVDYRASHTEPPMIPRYNLPACNLKNPNGCEFSYNNHYYYHKYDYNWVTKRERKNKVEED